MVMVLEAIEIMQRPPASLSLWAWEGRDVGVEDQCSRYSIGGGPHSTQNTVQIGMTQSDDGSCPRKSSRREILNRTNN